MSAAGIWGVGRAIPPEEVTNDDFVNRGMETSDAWIRERTGIGARRHAATDVASSDLAHEAALHAIENAGINSDEIDLIIVATASPDYPLFPSVACLLQERLGLPQIGAFDVSAACSGFNYALTTATQFVKTGAATRVLVVGVDCLSKFTNQDDRSIAILFGDGAGAAIVGPVQDGYGVLSSNLHASGKEADILQVKAGGSRYPLTAERMEKLEHYIKMDGRAVFKVAINTLLPSIQGSLADNKIEAKDVKLFIFHQANKRIIDHCKEKLGLRDDQVFINIEKYGNTSSASIPIALSEALDEQRLQDGDLLFMIGFGAGFTWASNMLRWGGRG